MNLMFDTGNLSDIKKYMEYYPICGVTSNPSILKEEGKIDFFSQLKKIRKLIGEERELLVQIVSENSQGMIDEAHRVLERVDNKVNIKIPVTEQGLKALMQLNKDGIKTTATAIYTKEQGFLGIMAGADYMAPYCNRMDVLGIDFMENISSFRDMIEQYDSSTKILAASFKNIAQVNKAYIAGAHVVTVKPSLLHEAISNVTVQEAVSAFTKDWQAIHENKGILDL